LLNGVQQSLSQRWRGRKSRFTKMLESTPQRLEGQAFIGRFVRNTISLDLNNVEALRLDFFLSRSYLASYLLDLDANLLVDFDTHDLSCGLRADDQAFRARLISARALDFIFKLVRIYNFVYNVAQWDDLLILRTVPEFTFLTLFAFKENDLYEVRRAAIKADAASFRTAVSLSMTLSNIQRLVDTMFQQGALADNS
jgi:hypothetical protein